MDVQAAFDKLLETHPVTLDGDVPDKTERQKVSPDYQRQLYERWLKAQMKLRVRHVLAYFCRRLPTEKQVGIWIVKQGWTSNFPNAANIIKEWKPSGSVDMVMDSKHIQTFTSSQKWRGLLVADVEGKGKGVIATRRFQSGEVVCDYHGRVITAKEGHHIQKNISEEETVYMFFYRNQKGQPMCIDAHSALCECHPKKQTVGKFINYSKAAANLRPKSYNVTIDGEENEGIIFLATRNIEVNEELLFNYEKSFCGDAGLAWLS
ncbi:N-lysine methyltransferase KMT5A-like [Thunnus maccoyii]|uniref:N-lysine methyltransferase KMT5A-like n=1 Tax=Thunnus maccoyii TaxID=8240 RepID=UPI001C4B55BD|nr:N-lysine methyltransferase KMT5A-like [Thunnus maccoyii]